MRRNRVARMGVGVLVGVCSVGLLGGPTWAEESARPKQAADGQERAERDPGLSEEQRSRLKQIRQEYKARREGLREQLEALRKEEQGKVRAILTPEQQARWDEKRERRQQSSGERRADGPRRPKQAGESTEESKPKKRGWGLWGAKSGEGETR